MCSKRMTKRVATDLLDQSRLAYCNPNCLSNQRFICMMSPFFSGLQVFPTILLRENPLPTQVPGCFRIFVIKGVW